MQKRDPKEIENDDWILFAIKYPNPECRKVTVGYYRNGNFYDFLSNTLCYDDGHEPRMISRQFVEWWAEMPKYQEA